jgi:hypothetical protein
MRAVSEGIEAKGTRIGLERSPRFSGDHRHKGYVSKMVHYQMQFWVLGSIQFIQSSVNP